MKRRPLAAQTRLELLIADDDHDFRATVARRFQRPDCKVREAASGNEVLDLLNEHCFDVAILDMIMPGPSGIEILQRIRNEPQTLEVILLTGQGTIDSAVRAMKLGAYDYLTKPIPLRRLELVVRKAWERSRLEKENHQLKALFQRSQSDPQIIGQSSSMQKVVRLIERAAPNDHPILIQGASGTGKELVARALHRRSLRSSRPLVTVNCAAIPDQLLESELFGHERGAFTGAVAAKEGLFEIADEATLFIDEIGEMPTAMQPKLLRVLEDGSMRRVGSLRERRVNVRVITATNRNLADECKKGRFREDLFYRINAVTIELPSLRQRRDDIGLFVNNLLGSDWTIVPEALEQLENYDWPGNVRQLINVIERAKILCDNRLILGSDLPPEVLSSPDSSPAINPVPMPDDLDLWEKEKVVEVLNRVHGNKARAAHALGITRFSLYRLLQRYGLDRRKN